MKLIIYDFDDTLFPSYPYVKHLLNYDLIFIGHEHNAFTVDNKLYDVGSSGCRKDNTTQYTIFDTETFTVETKSLEYDRTNFEQDLLKENYPDRNLIAKCFFGIEL